MPKREKPGNRGGVDDALSELLSERPTLDSDDDIDAVVVWYSRVVLAYEKQLVRKLYRKCRDWQLAEDAAQEGFLQGLLQIRRYDPRFGSFTAWIKMMSRSRLRDLLRKRNRKSLPFSSTPLVSSDREEGIVAEAKSPPFEFREHFRKVFEDFVTTLATFDRNLLRFRLAGFTYAEIQEVMPTSFSVPALCTRTKQLIQECRRFWRDDNNSYL